ncbi:hypothetical protein N7457_001191 [Penicillium paradoxum]|uniref:uncharacterized protein n=1 Tax=Penicillium paradoxum TaxID=176176 RepID=UPI002548D660|nr:uncharacterized protein N7457_001191 [Penicillium paradoxum]KAJ5794592.1 hypothetical protein N7457_001191 [Penicillium paradoxum]
MYKVRQSLRSTEERLILFAMKRPVRYKAIIFELPFVQKVPSKTHKSGTLSNGSIKERSHEDIAKLAQISTISLRLLQPNREGKGFLVSYAFLPRYLATQIHHALAVVPLDENLLLQLKKFLPAVVPLRPSTTTCHASLKENEPFSFLQHFANPSYQKDRLAIGETAKCSVRRNLVTLNSRIEDALFNPDTLFPSKLSSQLSERTRELVETSKSTNLGNTEVVNSPHFVESSALLGVSNISASISAFFHSLHWHLPVVHFPAFDPADISNPLLHLIW